MLFGKASSEKIVPKKAVPKKPEECPEERFKGELSQPASFGVKEGYSSLRNKSWKLIL
jgi:hypothetical protein